MRIFTTCLLPLAAAGLFAFGTAQAAFIDPDFSGTTEFEGWSGLTAVNNPGYPTFGNSTSAWPAPIAPNEPNSAGSAAFDKLSGGGYPSGSSIYNSFSAGTFVVFDNSPLADLENVFFQIDLGAGQTVFPGGDIGFFDPEAPGGGTPVLNFNGGSQALAPTVDFSSPGGTPFVNFITLEPDTTTAFAFQWDLSGLGPITSYQIEWTSIEFGTAYGLQLDTSTIFTEVTPIPEPTSLALLGLAAAAALARRH